MNHLHRTYKKGIARTASLLLGMTFALTGILAIPLSASALSSSVIYNNIPSPVPGNVVSEAFEATSSSEFGGGVQFAGSNRYNPVVTVLMSSWGCQSGSWNADNCVTTPGTTFSEPITLNVYNMNADNSPGSLVTTITKTFNIPYRPSADNTHCTNAQAGEWYSTSAATCYNGLATPITFDLTGQNVTLPNKAIISVAYNTSDYGSHPYGDNTACHTTLAGCGYDSLNVGLNGIPSVGTPEPTANDVYQNSTWAGNYCDNGAGGTGTFRLDAGCWTGYLPAFEVTASPSLTTPPAHYSQCQGTDWKTFNNPSYKNQSECVTYVALHDRAVNGSVTYTAYGLNRTAQFGMDMAANTGSFVYQDANHDWYDVNVSNVLISGSHVWFAGVVTNSNFGVKGNWLFAEVQSNHPDEIWGSFTTEAAAQNGVANMSNPADGPFAVTKGDISIF